MKKLLITGVAFAALTVAPALAADMPRKAPVYMPPPPPVLSWNGWYVGLNAGAGWLRNDGTGNTLFSNDCVSAVPAGCPFAVGALNSGIPGNFDTGNNKAGFIGGGQIGYNWQWSPQFVWGIEADFQGADIKGDSNFASGDIPIGGIFPNVVTTTGEASQKLNFLGTLRGRLGWLVTPAALLYGTGGLAYGHTETDVSFAAHMTGPPTLDGSTFASSDEWRVGWTVGGGVEWMFAPNWSIKGEYLYYDLGHVTLDQTLTAANVGGGKFISAGISSEATYRGSIARAGINYHF